MVQARFPGSCTDLKDPRISMAENRDFFSMGPLSPVSLSFPLWSSLMEGREDTGFPMKCRERETSSLRETFLRVCAMEPMECWKLKWGGK